MPAAVDQQSAAQPRRRRSDFEPKIEKLTDDEIEAIAERAAEKAIAKITLQTYAQIGKHFIGKFLWLVGASILGFAIAKGWVTFKP